MGGGAVALEDDGIEAGEGQGLLIFLADRPGDAGGVPSLRMRDSVRVRGAVR